MQIDSQAREAGACAVTLDIFNWKMLVRLWALLSSKWLCTFAGKQCRFAFRWFVLQLVECLVIGVCPRRWWESGASAQSTVTSLSPWTWWCVQPAYSIYVPSVSTGGCFCIAITRLVERWARCNLVAQLKRETYSAFTHLKINQIWCWGCCYI